MYLDKAKRFYTFEGSQGNLDGVSLPKLVQLNVFEGVADYDYLKLLAQTLMSPNGAIWVDNDILLNHEEIPCDPIKTMYVNKSGDEVYETVYSHNSLDLLHKIVYMSNTSRFVVDPQYKNVLEMTRVSRSTGEITQDQFVYIKNLYGADIANVVKYPMVTDKLFFLNDCKDIRRFKEKLFLESTYSKLGIKFLLPYVIHGYLDGWVDILGADVLNIYDNPYLDFYQDKWEEGQEDD